MLDAKLGRRAFLGGMSGAAVAITLAACSGGSGAGSAFRQPSENVPAKYAKRQRIVAWHRWSSANGQAITELANRFNASQSDIYLDMQPQTGTYDNLSAKVAAGLQAHQIPDLVALSEVTFHQFFLNQTLEPLDGYFGKGLAKSELNQQLLRHGELSGDLYWLPFAESTPLFYYNKQLVARAGLPDRVPHTWSELREWGAHLKGLTYNGSSPKLMAYQQTDGDWPFQGMLWNFGGGISKGLDIIIDNEQSVAAGEFERALVNDDHMAYMAAAPQTDFENGLVAFHEDSSGALTTIMQNTKFDVGTGFVPMEKERAVPTGGGGFSIMAGASSDRKKAAFEFLAFISKPEQAAFWSASSGYLPLVDSAKKQKTLTETIAKYPGFQTLFDQQQYARKEDDVALFTPNASTTIYTGLQKIWTQNATAKSVLSEVAESLKKSTTTIKAQYQKQVK